MQHQFIQKIGILLLAVAGISVRLSAQNITYPVDAGKISTTGAIDFTRTGEGSFRIRPKGSNGAILINDPETLAKIPSMKYLVLHVRHPGSYSGILHIEFFAGGKIPVFLPKSEFFPGCRPGSFFLLSI